MDSQFVVLRAVMIGLDRLTGLDSLAGVEPDPCSEPAAAPHHRSFRN
jgi:hypothetical protein